MTTLSASNHKIHAAAPLPWIQTSINSLESLLVARYGEEQRQRAARGLKQIAEYWRVEDGNAADLEEFVQQNFAGDQAALDAMFSRFEHLLEQYEGHAQEISREFRTQLDLDLGPLLPLDEVFAGYDPTAHFLDDSFQNKLAFVVLLNFPLTTLKERLGEGRRWTRRQWAEVRLAQRFSKRIPARVSQAIAQAASNSERYVSEYNIWMHQLVDVAGSRLFPPGLRLLSHWSLRDEIKASYTDGSNGLAKQRMIRQVMERIIRQEIPAVVVNSSGYDWNPFTNEVKPAANQEERRDEAALLKPTTGLNGPPTENMPAAIDAPERDTRYAVLLECFRAVRQADPYSPTAPTWIARRFDEDREIPEERSRQMLEQVVSSPLVETVAALIRQRLGRSLEPFDIWYNGFRAQGSKSEPELDRLVAGRYPTLEDYRREIPQILLKLGFSQADAARIAANIAVDPGRGAGHAMGAAMRTAQAHLRTRVDKSGMNYKSFNVAMHELGHNVEQTLSLNDMDHWLLHGVPNTAFTEAFAFIFQARDLQMLGVEVSDPDAEALKTLNDFWGAYEIAGVSLVDIAVWHWMYDHPEAAPAELKQAVLAIAKNIWNRYYAGVFGQRDVVLLAVYSHMIDAFLYLPDYPIGHLIAFQIEEQIRKSGAVGPEFARMVKAGSIAPDLWMQAATGAAVGSEALLQATERALGRLAR